MGRGDAAPDKIETRLYSSNPKKMVEVWMRENLDRRASPHSWPLLSSSTSHETMTMASSDNPIESKWNGCFQFRALGDKIIRRSRE